MLFSFCLRKHIYLTRIGMDLIVFVGVLTFENHESQKEKDSVCVWEPVVG